MSHKGHYNTRHTALWSCTHITKIALTYLERQKRYVPDKLRWEEAEAEAEEEEKIRLKKYVSLRSKVRHNNDDTILSNPGKVLIITKQNLKGRNSICLWKVHIASYTFFHRVQISKIRPQAETRQYRGLLNCA
jgi:hypothetical protein